MQAHFHLILDPHWELVHLVASLEPCICEDHHSVIIFASEYSTYTLRALPHRIESEEFVFSDLESVVQILHSRSQISAQCVLVWDSEHHHSSSVMSSKVDTFRDLTSGNGEEDSPTTIVACLFVVFKSKNSLKVIFRLDIDQFVLSDFLQDSHFIPLKYDMLHISIGCKEAHNAIGDNLTQLNK